MRRQASVGTARLCAVVVTPTCAADHGVRTGTCAVPVSRTLRKAKDFLVLRIRIHHELSRIVSVVGQMCVCAVCGRSARASVGFAARSSHDGVQQVKNAQFSMSTIYRGSRFQGPSQSSSFRQLARRLVVLSLSADSSLCGPLQTCGAKKGTATPETTAQPCCMDTG